MASPNCVRIIGDENASRLYVSLNVTDAISAAVRGMPDVKVRGAKEQNFQGSGGLARAQQFFDSMPLDKNSIQRMPNGTVKGELADGTSVGFYLSATSTKGPSVQITRPNGQGIKIRF